MSDSEIPERFYKVESPYYRSENDNGDYVISKGPNGSYEKNKFSWIFDRAEEVEAIEKLDGCFTYKTRVTTRDSGEVKIGKIVNNELDVEVLTYNFSSGLCEYHEIDSYHKYDTESDLVTVELRHSSHGGNNRSIVATSDHELWTDNGWVEASDVTTDHTVYTNGEQMDAITQQVLVGTLLGDGTVESGTGNTVKYTHGADQYDYLDWKRDQIMFQTTVRSLGEGGFSGSKERKSVRVATNNNVANLCTEFDRDGEKVIPDTIDTLLRPLAIAVWYMDDGTVGGPPVQRPRSSFATNSFDVEECEKLASVLREQYNIGCTVNEYFDGPRIECTADGTEILHELIWPYVPQSMEYKLMDQYQGTQCCLDSYKHQTDGSSLVEAEVVFVTDGAESWRNTSSVYDICVPPNHNYFAGGVLVHNTNMAVYIEHKHGEWSVTKAATRMGNKKMNRVLPLGPKTNHHYITRAIQNSIRRGYVRLVANEYGEGWYFGEAVGPKFQGNPHQLDERLFVPFDWVRDKLEYRSYGDYPTNFEAIRDWFRGEENGLFSLFASRIHGQDLESSRPANGTFVEGLILVHPDFEGRIRPEDLTVGNDGQSVKELAKLRRDQFEGFQNDEWPLTKWGH